MLSQPLDGAVLEIDADGQLIETTPTAGGTGARNQTLADRLWLGVRQSGLPLKVFDSPAGFQLPEGSMRPGTAIRRWAWSAAGGSAGAGSSRRRHRPPAAAGGREPAMVGASGG